MLWSFFMHNFVIVLPVVILRRSRQPVSHPCVRTASCAATTTWTLTAAASSPLSSTWTSLWSARSAVQASKRVSTVCHQTPPSTPFLSLLLPTACPTWSPSLTNCHPSHQAKTRQHICAHATMPLSDLLCIFISNDTIICWLFRSPGGHLTDWNLLTKAVSKIVDCVTQYWPSLLIFVLLCSQTQFKISIYYCSLSASVQTTKPLHRMLHIKVSGVLDVVMAKMQSYTYPINQRFHLSVDLLWK